MFFVNFGPGESIEQGSSSVQTLGTCVRGEHGTSGQQLSTGVADFVEFHFEKIRYSSLSVCQDQSFEIVGFL